MVSETLLFWGVLAGLLCLDNLVLLPVGADYLRFSRSDRWRYEPRARLQARQRDLVLLNPLNPFDRLAQTDSAIGNLNAQSLRIGRKRVRSTLRHANLLSLIGSVYLLLLVGLAFASIWLYFGHVLLTLLFAHFVTWIAAMAVIVTYRQKLCLSRFRAISLAFEAFLVPGYLVNLGKRVWYRQILKLPALSLGLRQLKLMPADSARDLYAMQMSRRLDDLAIDFSMDDDQPHPSGANDTNESSVEDIRADVEQIVNAATPYTEARREELRNWFKEARQCLATSVQAVG